MIRWNTAFIVFLVIACTASCALSAPTAVPPTFTQLPSPVPTAATTGTSAPVEIHQIPGFEEWTMLNAPAVNISSENDALILTLKHQALWFMNQRGVLAYQPVEGDFRITADVYTSKSSAPDQPPGGDGTVQLGGIMARNGSGGRENYVFIVVGDDGDGISVETKNTTDNFSEYDGPAWDGSSAQLRICRLSSTFTLYKRPIGAGETWLQAASFDRPDLPSSLQVGVNLYSDSTPDLQVRYENIRIEELTSPSECEID